MSSDPLTNACALCGEAEVTQTFGDGSVCESCHADVAGGTDIGEAASTAKETVANRLREVGFETSNIINVADGEKASVVDHTDSTNRYDDPRDVPGINYGILATGEMAGGLVIFDIDDYGDDIDVKSLAAVSELPKTFTLQTPHTDGDIGGHRPYKVIPGDEFETAQDALHAITGNRKRCSPTWGDVQVTNTYVVGPGSQLDSCTKGWCDQCVTDDGGMYCVADDRTIATITADDVAELLRADPRYGGSEDVQGGLPVTNLNPAEATAEGRGFTGSDTDLIAAARASQAGDRFQRLFDRGDTSRYQSHSEARMALLNDLAFWTGGDQNQMDRLFRQSGLHPHPEKPGKWERVGSDEIEKAIAGTQEFYNPNKSGGPTDSQIVNKSWEDVRGLYLDNDIANNLARDAAFRRLNEQDHFLAVRDTEKLYRYDPATGIYKRDGEQRVGEAIERGLGQFYSKQERSQLISRIKDRHWVDRDELGGPKGAVCVANGVLDLTEPADPVLREHSPEDRFIASLPTAADPMSAKEFDPGEECPEFMAFLDQVIRDEDRAKVQEYAGYCLHTWGQPYKRVIVCLGETDSGKSTFLSIIRAILGGDNVASESLYSLVQTRWGKANLYGAFANIRNELSPGDLKYPQTFKEITSGQDPVDAERKGEDKFTFVPTAKHLFAANQVPSVGDSDDAFYNRWLFATFPTSVPRDQQEQGLADRLVDKEAVGILNWMIEGYARLNEQGGFSNERGLGSKEDMWHAYGDSVERFVDRCLEVTGEKKDYLAKKDAHAAFTAMCDELGLSSESQGQFTRELKRREGIDDAKPSASNVTLHLSHNDNRVRCYTGLKLTDMGREYLTEPSGGGGTSITDYD